MATQQVTSGMQTAAMVTGMGAAGMAGGMMKGGGLSMAGLGAGLSGLAPWCDPGGGMSANTAGFGGANAVPGSGDVKNLVEGSQQEFHRQQGLLAALRPAWEDRSVTCLDTAGHQAAGRQVAGHRATVATVAMAAPCRPLTV